MVAADSPAVRHGHMSGQSVVLCEPGNPCRWYRHPIFGIVDIAHIRPGLAPTGRAAGIDSGIL